MDIANLPGDLWRYYNDGGMVMHMISLLSVTSITVIIYKLLVFKKTSMDTNTFIGKVRKSLLQGNVQGAIKVCEEYKGATAAIVKAGLLKIDKPREEMEKTMENAAIHEVAYLEKFLAVLATITNIAPLLGFLGTVVGMILSFETIAEQGLSNPGAVAKGISVALLTTAYGLVVAFVTQPFYNYFTSKIAVRTREIETVSNILFETLDEMESMKTGNA